MQFTKFRPNVVYLAIVLCAASVVLSLGYGYIGEYMAGITRAIALGVAGFLVTGSLSLAKKLHRPIISPNIWTMTPLSLIVLTALLLGPGFADATTEAKDVAAAALMPFVGSYGALFMAILNADHDD